MLSVFPMEKEDILGSVQGNKNYQLSQNWFTGIGE